MLRSLVCHEGLSASSGHYISFVSVGDKWYECNDSLVSSCMSVHAHSSSCMNLCMLKTCMCFSERERERERERENITQ